MKIEHQKALAHWFLEVGALFFVFPILDFMFHTNGAVGWAPYVGFGLGLIYVMMGLYFVPEEE